MCQVHPVVELAAIKNYELPYDWVLGGVRDAVSKLL